MLKRTLYFTTPATLSLKECQLIVHRSMEEEDRSIPIEDIGVIVIENLQITVTLPLLSALSQNNVAVIFCNEKHLPQSILQNLDVNTSSGMTIRLQMNVSEPMRKNAWKQIIESKIKNQSLLLNKLHKNGCILKPYYSSVKSGDFDNREGLAARLYWKELFGDDFSRDRESEGINSLLNYGYTIFKSRNGKIIGRFGADAFYWCFS